MLTKKAAYTHILDVGTRGCWACLLEKGQAIKLIIKTGTHYFVN